MIRMWSLAGRILLLSLLIAIAGGRAWGHDEWTGGKKVDPVTKALCCDQSDTKVVDDLVQAASGGVSFSDWPGTTVPYSRIQPSPDGHWWRSVWGGEIKCVFGPMSY